MMQGESVEKLGVSGRVSKNKIKKTETIFSHHEKTSGILKVCVEALPCTGVTGKAARLVYC